jgi:hypothetical protein
MPAVLCLILVGSMVPPSGAAPSWLAPPVALVQQAATGAPAGQRDGQQGSTGDNAGTDGAVSAEPGTAPLDRPAAPEQAAPDQQAKPGQPDPEAKEPPTPAHTGIHALIDGVVGDFKHLPSMPNLMITMAGGGGALALRGFDHTLNARLRGHEDTAEPVFVVGKYIGQTPVQVGVSLATYAYGRATGEKKVSHLGMDLLRAQIVTGALTSGLKYATQRERPDHSNAHSFPSGHASVTFATATVIERHLGWRMSALGYGVASYVAASRLHDNRHWLTDVVFGAAVGTIGGRTVTQHGRNYWTLVPTTVPGGAAVYLARTSESRRAGVRH